MSLPPYSVHRYNNHKYYISLLGGTKNPNPPGYNQKTYYDFPHENQTTKNIERQKHEQNKQFRTET